MLAATRYAVMAFLLLASAARGAEVEEGHKWQQEAEEYRRLAQERGEKLDWRDYAPPDIPGGRETHELVMAFGAAEKEPGPQFPRGSFGGQRRGVGEPDGHGGGQGLFRGPRAPHGLVGRNHRPTPGYPPV